MSQHFKSINIIFAINYEANSIKGILKFVLGIIILYPMYALIGIIFFSSIGIDPLEMGFMKPFFLMFDFILALILIREKITSFNYTSIFNQFISYRFEMIIIAIVIYFLSRTYVISADAYSKINFKPLTLFWETQVYFRLRDQAVAFNESLLKYMANKKSVKYGFMIHISGQGNTTIIVGITGRRIIPKRKKELLWSLWDFFMLMASMCYLVVLILITMISNLKN